MFLTDMNMRKSAVITASLLLLASFSSCTNADYQHEVHVVGITGRLFVSKTGTAIPLSDDRDALDYEVGSTKRRIFTGTGGKTLSVGFYQAKDLLIISYCGGRIEQVESSFSDTLSTDGEGWKIYRTQVINNPGFKYAATHICQ